ncbi:MAG: hypothetical protein DRJ61_08670 [Acidobacteria bacterium]|nr:MAG: hypothetical protein DRJ65_08890 [Acidobacteriota bacterium]RLE32807.1 MAG: hypothetical protein DRJ61_08670 [Acidobacteriota bacterium]
MRISVVFALILLVVPMAAVAQGIGPGGAVPAVANLPGLAGTFWQSDVIIHNPGETQISIRLLLFPEIRNGGPEFDPVTSDSMSVPALGQLTISNVVQSVFGKINTKGALSVISEDGSPIVIGSRTYTYDDDGGSYGQEVFGILVSDHAWASGAQNDSLFRTNVGVYMPIAPAQGSTVDFEVIIRDSSGTEITRGTMPFPAAGMQQRSLSSLGADQLLDGSVEVVCSDPSFFWYGYISRVDQISGDAVFRPLRGMGF